MLCWRAVIAVLIVSTLGCVSMQGTPGTPSQQMEYHVAPPDVLAISVRPAPEITRDVVVRPDGRISFDLIGEVEVQGKTVKEIRDEIASRIGEYIVRPDVTVLLQQSNSRQFFMFGEVLRPGAYPLIGTVTAVQALATAGGPTRFANQDVARLVRPSEGESLLYRVDFDAITKKGDATTNYELEPGDIIYMPPGVSARIGYAINVIFFPIQQILGLGGQFISPVAY